MSMINMLFQMAKEVSAMDKEQVNKEIDNLKVVHDIEQEVVGRNSLETTLRGHLLIAKMLE